MVYRFDQFEVDDREFRLSEDGTPVQLEPKALRLLIYLIENRNRLVRKQELLDAVWPDAMVTENALTRAIGLLRKALREDSRVPRYLETIPTAGYRFIAIVTAIEETANKEIASAGPIAPVAPTSAPANHQAGFRWSKKWILASTILLVGLGLAGVLLFFHHGTQVLTDKDTVVLADFDNSTGDPVFDGTLRRGMAVQLEQSPFLSLIPDDRIQEVLKEMGQPADARLTSAIARELCERTSSAAVLDGSIAPLGSQYVLGLRALDCQSGKVLAEEQVQAARKEDVLNALSQIAVKFRTQVGESLTTVEKYDTPLAEATTSSLEALKAYSLGLQKADSGAQVDSLPLFSRAVELDPNFAEAYQAMSVAYGIQREPGLSADAIRKAYALREKVSEWERLNIEISYYLYVTGELEKTESAMELELQTYPRKPGAHIGLGVINGRLGNLEKSLAEAREALRLMPTAAVNYQNLGADLVNLERFDEADAVYKLSDERNLPYVGRSRSLYFLAFLQGDQARMARVASSAMGKRGQEDAMLGAQADTEAWYGRMTAARAFTRKAMDSALTYDAKETAAGYQVKQAPFEAEVGYTAQARADAEAAIKSAPNRDVRLFAAMALAQAGDTASAEKLAAELDKDFPLDTHVQRYWLPSIRGAIALQRKDPARAIELLHAESPLDMAGASNLTNASFYPVYVRGQAYLMLHDGSRAAAEFQKYIDYRGLVRNTPIAMLGRLGLARAYAMQGDTAKARAAYQNFLATWKDADPDIPILIQAKAEYAKLR
jgi:DNA-binding winged helix-turn-helix (wHTH) protein/Flp pilus assembly protein TadD